MVDIVLNDKKLSKADGINLVKQTRDELTEFWEQIIEEYSTDDVISELCRNRGYVTEDMRKTLSEVGVVKIDFMSTVTWRTMKYATHKLWGLTNNETGVDLLSGRYIIPIRDMTGKITALVGWYNDQKKYITTPTFGFSKDAQFFNIEQFAKYEEGSKVFLVEGIFDTLAIRSLGLFALGNMGLNLSPIKVEILKRFGHVYAMPDGDKAGRSVLPFVADGNSKWNIKENVSFVSLQLEGAKDADDAVKYYDVFEYLNTLGSSYLYQMR